jgi:hypothetical protein
MVFESESTYKKALQEVLGFLERSINVHDGSGSAHSYSYWLNSGSGWKAPYPETTGYMISTLIRAGSKVDKKYESLASKCADWLLTVQHPEGWIHTGIDPENGPSIFNTAMVASGFSDAFVHFKDERYLMAAGSGVDWILDQQEEGGEILKFAFEPGFFPAYYSRVLWALVKFKSISGHPSESKKLIALKRALDPLFNEKEIGSVGFKQSEPAFLHTLAYAIRGAQEVGNIEPSFRLEYRNVLEDLVARRRETGKWPGMIDVDGSSNYKFQCLTGEAQMALILLRSGNADWRSLAEETIRSLIRYQGRWGQAKGGLPGSKPFWGKYNPLRYPNWASKFLADALLELIFE